MKEIYKQIAKQFGKDERVVKLICEHPLLFTKHRMEDPNDLRPIMITHFAKFVLKTTKTVKDKELSLKRYLTKKSIAMSRIINSSKQKQEETL